MQKIAFILLSAVLVTSLSSAQENIATNTLGIEDKASKARLKNTMRKFATGLDFIQKGIIYNKKENIEKGAKIIKQAKKNFFRKHGEFLRKKMPENPKFATYIAKNSSNRISKYIDFMSDRINSSQDFNKIASSYMAIFNQCIDCHKHLRKNFSK